MPNGNIKFDRKMKKLIFMSAALCVMAACNEKVISTPVDQAGTGYISLALDSDPVISVKSVTDAELDEYNVYIVPAGGAAVSPVKYSDLRATPYAVLAGDYTMYAENCTAAEAETGVGQMHIYGGTEHAVTVRAGMTESVQINCSVINSAVRAEFDESFNYAFAEDYTIDFSAGTRTVEVNAEKAGQNIYWNVNEFGELALNYTITVTFRNDNAHKTQSGTVSLSKARVSVLKFSAGSNGRISVAISADDGMTEVDVPVIVDPYNE